MDSELVVSQLEGWYRVRDAKLVPLADRARALSRAFESHEIRHVPRAENDRADALAKRALDEGG